MPPRPAPGGRRWRGNAGELVTGHAVLRLVDGEIDRVAEGHAVTTVRFARPDRPSCEAYLATGEPLVVAGAFTLDGLGGWFVDGIDGDPSNVLGISLPLPRRLLARVGVSVPDLWAENWRWRGINLVSWPPERSRPQARARTPTPSGWSPTDWLAEHLGDPASSSSSPTKTCCSTTSATSPAR